jgi:hypothetical protein
MILLVLQKISFSAESSAPNPITAKDVTRILTFVVHLAHMLREILLSMEPHVWISAIR